MLDAIRSRSKGVVASILIGLLVFAFAIWGVGDMFTNYGANSVASVGSREVDIRTFQRAYNLEIQTLNQRLGTPLTNPQAAALGIPNQVLARLTNELILAETADKIGLGISEDELGRQIRADPTLRGPSGRYDPAMLRQAISFYGMSEQDFVEERRDTAIGTQLTEGLIGNMTVPSAYMEAFNLYRNEERSADYIVLETSNLPPLAEATEAELRTFFDANTAQFKAPEARTFELVVVDTETLSDPDAITDDEALAEYEATKDTSFGVPERRNFDQLPFGDLASAQAAAQKIADGTPFEEIVAAEEKELTDIAFGLKGRSEILDDAIAEAVFSRGVNEVGEPVEGRFGHFLIRVTDIQEESLQPFEEVKEQIKSDLAGTRAESEVFETYDEIEDARAGGATLREAAERFSLSVRVVEAVDREGNQIDGTRIDLPDRSNLLSGVFEAEIGEETDPLQTGRRGFVWFELKDVAPEKERPYDDVKDAVAVAWQEDKQNTRLDDEAEKIVQALKSGRTLAEMAEPFGLEVQTAEAIARSATPEGVPTPLTRAVFDGPEGHAGSVAGETAQTRIVFSVTAINEPAFFEEAAGNDQARQQLGSGLQRTLLGQYVQKVQTDIGVTVNNRAIGLVLGLNNDHSMR
ncbi:MAG: SurA N-terminal domain-containing protein [Pseudomonadota bacterium]